MIIFAKNLGSFLLYTRTELGKTLSNSDKPKDIRPEGMKLTFFDLGLSLTPNFDIWFFRIMGALEIIMAIIFIFLLIFT
jgi:hypothetical protein